MGRQWLIWSPLLLLVSGMTLAAGSWVDRESRLHVSLSDRETVSAPLTSGGQAVVGGSIADVRWRFRLPPGRAIGVRLCHPERCVSVSGQRGMTGALAGLAADVPLRFRFAPKAGQTPLTVEGLQVIVNYR